MKNFNKFSNTVLILVLLGMLCTAFGQVVADPNAPKNQQPTILETSGKVPQINITTPSAKGVSMNQFKQFDVLNNGAILNNSRTNVLTQLGGFIQGNPWLAGGSARIIVAQINSTNPSFLNGYIEIAGQRAEVIFANPAGININGGGFINANRVTLTTGTPLINLGGLDGFRVNQGVISIFGDGLDTSGADYTQILSRGLILNAGLWANDLRVVTGANEFSALDGSYTSIAANGNAPLLAIDTGVLGGMYSNKIMLFGTENGLGVNNAGQIGSLAGNVTIDVNGILTNSGTINANGSGNNAQIKAASIFNSGIIAAQGNTNIFAAEILQNSGTIGAGRELILRANNIDNSNGILKGQRLDFTAFDLNNSNGKIQQTGLQSLALNSGNLINSNGGLIGYPPEPTPEPTPENGETPNPTPTPAETLETTANGGGTTTSQETPPENLAPGVINITGTINNEAGEITANGGIDLTSTTGLVNGGILNLNKLFVTGDIFDNSNGILTANGAFINTNRIINNNGQLGSSKNLDLIGKSLFNQGGTMTAGESLTANISGAVINDDGILASDGALTLNAESLENVNGVIASNENSAAITTTGKSNNENGAISSAENLTIKSGELNNTLGLLNSKTIEVKTGTNQLTNDRGIISGQDVSINSGLLSNDGGLINSLNNLSINTNNQDLFNLNSGDYGIISGGNLSLQTGNLFNDFGYLRSQGSTTANINGDLYNFGGTFASDSVLEIRANNIVDNQFGLIASVNEFASITTTGLVNNAGGTIQSATSLKINSDGLDNSDGSIDAADVEIETNQNALYAFPIDTKQ